MPPQSPHKTRKSLLHPTAIFFVVLFVLALAHFVFPVAQSPTNFRHPTIDGRWLAVRRSFRLPPPKSPSRMLPLALHITSRFDLKHKRALEEAQSFSFADVDAPPQLYFAADAVAESVAKEKYRESRKKKTGIARLKPGD